jgi:hypothetical protein
MSLERRIGELERLIGQPSEEDSADLIRRREEMKASWPRARACNALPRPPFSFWVGFEPTPSACNAPESREDGPARARGPVLGVGCPRGGGALHRRRGSR